MTVIRDQTSGIHAIQYKNNKLIGLADPRREGTAKVVDSFLTFFTKIRTSRSIRSNCILLLHTLHCSLSLP